AITAKTKAGRAWPAHEPLPFRRPRLPLRGPVERSAARRHRAFILAVGNGGPGPPQSGLLPLGEVPTGYDWPASDVLRDASRPFPFTAAWVWEGEADDDPEMRDAVQ